MPKKKKNSKHERFASKYQRSQQKPHKRKRNIIIAVILVVVLAAVGVGVWSYFEYQVKPYQRAAIRVNGVTFDLRYYINTLKLYYGKVSPSTLTDYTDYGEQDIEKFAAFVENQIVQNEIIKQGSQALGIQIERSTIETKLKESNIPVTNEHVDALMAQELVAEEVPSTQPQVHVQAMLLESESVAQEAIARLGEGESFEDVAVELSKIPNYGIINGDMGWVTAREADLTVDSTKLGDIVFGADTGVLSGPVYDDTVTKAFGYWVIKVVEKEDATDTTSARIHVKGVLVGSEQEANDVIDRLNAGEDIDELAKEVSVLPGAVEGGAELGWITQSEEESILSVLFDLPINGISAPIGDSEVETKGGYWVFNVVERDNNRELTNSQDNMLVNDFIERCTAELEKNPEYSVDILLTEEMIVQAINEVVLSQGEGSVFIRTNELPPGEAGLSYYYQLETYGNQKGNTWSITEGNLPGGLSLDESTGVISGTPGLAGGYSLTIEVNSGHHYWAQGYVMHVQIPVSITTSSLPDAEVGINYSELLEVFGDQVVFTWSIIDGSLPDGLSLSEYTGYISGTPTTAGTYDFTVQVDDGVGKATRELSILVQ
jgi:parvulin-like peptidyl-prolyl isomerase